MSFNSIFFAAFMAIVFFIYWKISNKYRWLLLLVASGYFYIGFGIYFFSLLLLVTVFSYLSGLAMGLGENCNIRKVIVSGSVMAIICMLAYFKYAAFLTQTVNNILKHFTIQLHPSAQKVVLPVGISFYSFKALSYVIDVYRGKKPEANLGRYAAYMLFFPEIASGPIDRADSLLHQLTKEHKFSYEKVNYGLKLVAWGLYKKIIVADTLAFFVDWVYGAYDTFHGFALLLTSLFFTIQIYCDFSGYSDMAIGISKMFDIEVMENFKSPYFSTSIREFWRRWHISLSTWFRDYLYIPLGGSRAGEERKRINLLITFLISGLWHGANWTFVFWGGVHGMAQILEDVCKRLLPLQKNNSLWKRCLKTILVFTFCNFAWIFFRADTIEQALYFIAHMLDGVGHPVQYIMTAQQQLIIDKFLLGKIGIMIFLVFIFDLFNKDRDVIAVISNQKKVVRWSIYVIFSSIIIIFFPVTPGTDFLYFQF